MVSLRCNRCDSHTEGGSKHAGEERVDIIAMKQSLGGSIEHGLMQQSLSDDVKMVMKIKK